jgi:formylmethanofuran dehydrogenase subunit E
MSSINKPSTEFEQLLDESVKIHRHLCPGQVLGVRMSMLGLKLIGIEDPKGDNRKDFVVYVEIDRCATDAIQSVTGCSLGKRSLKFMDYGKMAATFANLKTGRAMRILAIEDSKDKAKNYFPEIENKYDCQTEAYKVMPDEELFQWEEVKVEVPEEDMPGRPLRRIQCEKCGEHVQDSRDVDVDGKTLCRFCADGGYYIVP